MLNEPTLEKLQSLKLSAMASAWTEQQRNPEVATLGFDERFGLLVDAEWLHRENVRLDRCLREARLRLSSASIEDIDFAPRRELDKPVIRQLASCRLPGAGRVRSPEPSILGFGIEATGNRRPAPGTVRGH